MQIPFDRPLVVGPFGVQHLQGLQIAIPQQLHTYVANYAVQVLNTAWQRSTTCRARMYVFNLLTFNGCVNKFLNQTVDLAFRIGWMSVMQRQKVSIELAADEAVNMALAYLTAEHVHVNQAVLAADLTQNAVMQMRQLSQNFGLQRNALYSIQWNELNGSSPQMAQGQPIQPTIGSNPTLLNVNVASASTDGGDEWGQVAPPAAPLAEIKPPGLAQADFVQSSQVVAPVGSDELFQPAGTPTASTTNTAPTYNTTSPQPPNLNGPQHPPQPDAKLPSYYASKVPEHQYPITVTTHKGKHEMDAMTHSRAYFDNTTMSAQLALANLQGAVHKMSQDQLHDVPAVERLTLGEIRLAMTIDDLFIKARNAHRRLGRESGKPKAIARVFGVAMNPSYGSSVVEQLLPTIYGADIRNIAERFKVAVDCKDPERPTPEQHENLVSACYIDRLLGRTLNDFFARGLRSTASTKMFSDSVRPAIDYFSNPANAPSSHVVLLQNYINIMQENLRNYATPENIDGVKAGLLDEDETDPTNVGLIVVPIAHSITLCNLTTQELEWETNWNGTDIDGKVTPTLFQIAQTLREDKRYYTFNTTYDWLVTGDGETFLIYENPDQPNMMRIFPVSGLNINLLKTQLS